MTKQKVKEKKRRLVLATTRKGGKRRIIEDDDERAQKIMKFLWGSWWVTDLEKRIARYFQCKGHPMLKEVSEKIADLHCSGEGYIPQDITDELEKLLPGSADIK